MSTSARSYHHGDLRAALVDGAVRLLEDGQAFSLRAVAREVGVSPTAPYRHFADRDALESAVAAQGFRELETRLSPTGTLPGSREELVEFAVVYVAFALERPALFRVMFGTECDDEHDERVRAAAALHDLLARAVAAILPGRDADALATALWSTAHGLAFLHLDGKLRSPSRDATAQRVRASFAAIL